MYVVTQCLERQYFTTESLTSPHPPAAFSHMTAPTMDSQFCNLIEHFRETIISDEGLRKASQSIDIISIDDCMNNCSASNIHISSHWSVTSSASDQQISYEQQTLDSCAHQLKLSENNLRRLSQASLLPRRSMNRKSKKVTKVTHVNAYT